MRTLAIVVIGGVVLVLAGMAILPMLAFWAITHTRPPETVAEYNLATTVTLEIDGTPVTSRQVSHCRIIKSFGTIDVPGTRVYNERERSDRLFDRAKDGSVVVLPGLDPCDAFIDEPAVAGVDYQLLPYEGFSGPKPTATTRPVRTEVVWFDDATAPQRVTTAALIDVVGGAEPRLDHPQIVAAVTDEPPTPGLESLPFYAALSALEASSEKTPEQQEKRTRDGSGIVLSGLMTNAKFCGDDALRFDGVVGWVIVPEGVEPCERARGSQVQTTIGASPADVRMGHEWLKLPVDQMVAVRTFLDGDPTAKLGTKSAYGVGIPLQWTQRSCVEDVCASDALSADAPRTSRLFNPALGLMVYLGVRQLTFVQAAERGFLGD